MEREESNDTARGDKEDGCGASRHTKKLAHNLNEGPSTLVLEVGKEQKVRKLGLNCLEV